ncbi:MAG: hypothetical protein DAHOPDDO_00827 [Ignavibacteriaceae bacterium]|nr:hypothetical protein [Ignavibacteriaceae bacterium]
MSLENIPTENLLNGINKAFANADSLLSEARILEINEKWPRAYVLCQLALEELGKISLLFQLWIDKLNNKQIDYKKLNGDFLSHLEKTRLSILSELALLKMYKGDAGDESINKIIEMEEYTLGRVNDLNDLKKISLYVGIEGTDFFSPYEEIHSQKYYFIYDIALKRKDMFRILIEKLKENIVEIAKIVKENAG